MKSYFGSEIKNQNEFSKKAQASPNLITAVKCSKKIDSKDLFKIYE